MGMIWAEMVSVIPVVNHATRIKINCFMGGGFYGKGRFGE